MPPIDQIIRHLTRLPCRELLISNVDVIPATAIRIETTLMRPNGTYVDVFIDISGDALQNSENVTLSDFGTSWDYKLDLDKPSSRSSFEYIADSYGLRLDGQALSTTCSIGDILPNLLRLAQACIAMSNPGPFDRTRMVQVAQEKSLIPAALPSSSTYLAVVQTLNQSRTRFEQGVSIGLREGYDVQVDILINLRSRRAALMVVEHSPYEKVTMRRADHAFAIHTDLKETRWKGARFSILDEEDFYRVHRMDSFVRLGRVSKLISTSMLQEEGLGLAN
jgi:hypothetical protein